MTDNEKDLRAILLLNELGNLDSAPPGNAFAFFLGLFPIITVLGNLLVIVSVITVRNLHSSINFHVLGLAVADLLVGLTVMPFAIYLEYYHGNWYLGPTLCDIYCFADVSCSTASIFLLAVISFDRYRAATSPFEYATTSSSILRVPLIIMAAWLLSIAIASPIILGLNDVPFRANSTECRFFSADFSLYSSIGSFYVPCIVMLALYYQVYKVLREREKANKRRTMMWMFINQLVVSNIHATAASLPPSETQSPPGPESQGPYKPPSKICVTDTTSEESDKSITVYSWQNTNDTMVTDGSSEERRPSSIPKSSLAPVPEEEMVLTAVSDFDKTLGSEKSDLSSKECKVMSNREDRGSLSSLETSNFNGMPLNKKLTSKKASKVSLETTETELEDGRANSKSNLPKYFRRACTARYIKNKLVSKYRQKEQRATKTLAVVMSAFLICWLPFFITNSINAICLKTKQSACQVDFTIFIFTTWLGYMNSFLNPFIYAVCSSDFRAAYYSILCECSGQKSRPVFVPSDTRRGATKGNEV